MNAETFNSRHPVGTPVYAYPGLRPDDPFVIAARKRRTGLSLSNPDAADLSPRLVTRTRSKAEVLGGHTDVVWVDGHSSCIALAHVDVVSEAEWEAAKLADAVAEQGALPMPVGNPPQSPAECDALLGAAYAKFCRIHDAAATRRRRIQAWESAEQPPTSMRTDAGDPR